MAKLNRLTAKIFGETASTTNTPKEIGQFGSAKAGTYNATGDVATIQSLPAWSNGWIDAVTPTDQFPPLPEMTGVHKVLSYQNAYLLQQGIPEWDSATTYYTNNFCSKAGKIYISQSDNNLNNDPESDTVNWNVFESGGARNIGEIVASTIPLTDAGLHLLDGALIDGSGSYSAFVDYMADLYDSGDYTAIFDTEANWQSAVTTYGVCGKFVYNSVNNTVRLPKYSNKIYTQDITSTAPVKGNGMTLGVTDGSTNFGVFSGNMYANNIGTLQTSPGAYDSNIGTASSGSTYTGKSLGITTDGTKSGIITDLSNITTSLDGYYYIVIATTTKTDIQVDIDEIATDLNGKADVDLSNTTDTAKILMASMPMPSDKVLNLTPGATGTTYTAPANGYFYLRGEGASGTYIGLYDKSTLFGMRAEISGGTAHNTYINLPVRKGQVIILTYSVTTIRNFRFFYAVGSESEAQ